MRRRIPFLLVLGAVLFAGNCVRLPLFAEGPGPVRDVLPAISFSGHERFTTTGRLVLTTVAVTRDRLTPFQFVHAWLDPDEDLVPASEILPPGQTKEEEQQRAISSMDTSKIAAAYVVLSEVTSYPNRHGRGALVEQVADGCPAEGDLYPGDVILEIDGEPIRGLEDASRALQSSSSGEDLLFEIRAGDQLEQVHLTKEPCAGSAEPVVGVSMVPNFPIGISFRSGDVTGPSAGLMWALGLYELLSPDDLARGRVIAGTGAIDPSGEVMPIAGVQKKVLAAERAGADVFLIPDENLTDVSPQAGDLELIPVGSFEDAIERLNG